ncbi:MAG: (Fe-S)-binding protein [Thermodesulfobacteriota bacterium]
MSETARILSQCTDCGACVRACHFLGHYCDSPRELARRFSRNPFEAMEVPYACSLCGLCQRLCRRGLHPGGMCHEARVRIFRPLQGQSPPADFVYDFLTPRLKGIRNHQIFSSSSLFTMNRPPDPGPAGTVRRVFFPGCSLPAYGPDLVLKTYRYLNAKLPGTGVVLNCCGKPCKDMGDLERFDGLFRRTIETFERLQVDEVVVACINCHKTFRENSRIRLRTVYEVMCELGLPEHDRPAGGKVTIHDSCPARYQPQIRQAVREIAVRLGHTVHELRFRNELTQCCGAGGCAPTGNPALADRHTRGRAEQADGLVVTYCAHCRERFSSQVPALHLLDLVLGISSPRQPVLEAHDSLHNWANRWLVKRRLARLRA